MSITSCTARFAADHHKAVDQGERDAAGRLLVARRHDRPPCALRRAPPGAFRNARALLSSLVSRTSAPCRPPSRSGQPACAWRRSGCRPGPGAALSTFASVVAIDVERKRPLLAPSHGGHRARTAAARYRGSGGPRGDAGTGRPDAKACGPRQGGALQRAFRAHRCARVERRRRRDGAGWVGRRTRGGGRTAAREGARERTATSAARITRV